MKRFSDFATESALNGEKITLDQILDQELIIIAFSIKNSRYSKCNNGNYVIIQFEIKGINRVAFTASSVLCEQLIKYESQLPFIATITKIGSYYTLK